MPGLYLIAILISAAGILTLDLRWRLAVRVAPVRTAVSVFVGTVFFLLWDAAGIALGVFVKGDSPLLLGIDLAPELPLEEPVFLAFLSYLALVAWAASLRIADRAGRTMRSRTGSASDGTIDLHDPQSAEEGP